MRLYWGDYSRKTRHLKRAVEHGAYLLLIGALWDANGKIPADDASVAAHAQLTAREWALLKPKIMPFFRIVKGHLTHKRVNEELANYRATISKRKIAGKMGSSVTNGKRTRSGAANARQMPTYSESTSEDRLEGYKKPSNTIRRDASEARLDGASAFRVVEGGLGERESLIAAIRQAQSDHSHFVQHDPDFASEIVEFVEAAQAELAALSEAAA
jgi:uncharacterized protein YdaU (DUF1376 family)